MNEATVKRSGGFQSVLKRYSALIILVILIIISALLSDKFLTIKNIFNVLRQQAPFFLIAIGVLMTIVTGGIDLSPGAIIAVCNVFLAMAATNWGLNGAGTIFISMLIALIAGLIFGAFNGVLIARFKLAPFIATLAVMTIARGLAYQLTGGSPIRLPANEPGSGGLIAFGAHGDPVIGLPLAVWFAILAILVFWYLMKYTMYGRMFLATGSNETAMRLAGVNVSNYTFAVYVISGGMAGLAGILLTARAGIAVPTQGAGAELDAIAACVIGGASLSGGKGKIISTVIGVLIIALIANIMNLLSVPPYPQQMIQGAIIILAVMLNSTNKKAD